MFYPEAMAELELIVPQKDLLAVTKVLSNEGVFQQAENTYLGVDNGKKADNTWHEKAAAYATLERRIQAIIQSLGIAEGSPPAKETDTPLMEIDPTRAAVEKIEKEVRETSESLVNDRKKIEQLEGTLQQLEPIADLPLEVSALRNPRYVFSVLGTIPNDHIARMQQSIRVPHVFLTLRQDPQKSVVYLAGTKKNADLLDRAAKSAYLNSINLPDNYQGTPTEIISEIRAVNAQTHKHITELENTLAGFSKRYAEQLQLLLWQVRASRLLSDAIVRYGKLQYTYLVVGWAPTARLAELVQRVKQVSKETMVESSPLNRDNPSDIVPVSLKNPRFMGPFQTLVTTYARPRYNEIDPTFFIALTFPLLFGAMFGDAGQGVVLAVLGWLIMSKRIKALKSLSSLGGLILACGLSATVFGFLYGSIFGFEDVLHPIWMQPMNNIMQILYVAIGAGIVLLSTGFLIGIFNSFVARDWGHLFFDRNGIAGLVLYWSAVLLVVGVFTGTPILPSILLVILAVIGGIIIMFSEVFKRLLEGHRPLIVEGIGTFAIQSFFELFETLISFLSNSLSYVRVGAFAVAHGGLSMAIFSLAELVSASHGVGYWVVVLFGNLFIIGFEGLIVGIQTMRLEYYEFFSKFFTGGGARYDPMSVRPSVVD